MSFRKVICVEARQTLLGLQFKKTVVKECRPTSTQIKIYSNEDQNKSEVRL